MTEPRTVLVVDDDERLRSRLALALQDRGMRVVTAGDYPRALVVAAEAKPDRAVVDLRIPGGTGLQLVEALREAHPTLEIVVLTGYGSIASAVDAVRLGAVNYLTKPADADMVLAAFEHDAHPVAAPDYAPPTLARAEWELINRVLEDCGGNVSQAARTLGMHRRTLQRKLATYPPQR
ncbi:MAG: response regulator [Myxococcota bacterium]